LRACERGGGRGMTTQTAVGPMVTEQQMFT
jgi:hypothetical protein